MKRNKIFIPATSPEDWKQLLADPEKQWRMGYSARALAYCWQEANGIPDNVEKVLSKITEFKNLETLLVVPEHQVPLPGGTRPSQNDCWVLARTSKDLVSIAIEGKVSEPFGPSIGEWLDDYEEFAKLFGVEADSDNIISVGLKDDIDLYLAWICGDPQYLER